VNYSTVLTPCSSCSMCVLFCTACTDARGGSLGRRCFTEGSERGCALRTFVVLYSMIRILPFSVSALGLLLL